MNQLLLTPNDVLFFRDGRPMGGSLSGHGAAWPLPTVTNAALHAALHRAEISGVHSHRAGKSGHYSDQRTRKFGSLLTVGPFPVKQQEWLFPRPLDAGKANVPAASYMPLKQPQTAFEDISWNLISSLPSPLRFPVANSLLPSKDSISQWWNRGSWDAYLGNETNDSQAYYQDSDFSHTESTFGIGIDSDTGTQNGESFYSAHYLRLRENCHLGIIASAADKINNDPNNKRDLIEEVFPNSGKQTAIIAGGQQRICSVQRNHCNRMPLPLGMSSGFKKSGDKYLVKWILLSPAIFPAIKVDTAKGINDHPGGWLPNWIAEKDQVFEDESVNKGAVLLLDGLGKMKAIRKHRTAGKRINANLVAALTGKPIPVTGYALPHEAAEVKGGPKPTYLAVPAGSVYYFEAVDENAAKSLADALNWHGDTDGSHIKNRRSTLMGEKGFGLGVCGTWDYHSGQPPQA
jgi:CRISPR-associated protein Cmr3